MTDSADMHVRSPRTAEEALSLISAGVAVLRNVPITPDQNARLGKLVRQLRLEEKL